MLFPCSSPFSTFPSPYGISLHVPFVLLLRLQNKIRVIQESKSMKKENHVLMMFALLALAGCGGQKEKREAAPVRNARKQTEPRRGDRTNANVSATPSGLPTPSTQQAGASPLPGRLVLTIVFCCPFGTFSAPITAVAAPRPSRGGAGSPPLSPPFQGEGQGVGSVTDSMEFRSQGALKSLTPPPTPPLQGRGVPRKDGEAVPSQ